MDTIDKALSLIENYNSLGQDTNRIHVIKGVDFLLSNNTTEARKSFIESGLTKAGLIYFAIRQYMGDKEESVLKFILDEF